MSNKIYATFDYTTMEWKISNEIFRMGGANVVINLITDSSKEYLNLNYGMDFYTENDLTVREKYPKIRTEVKTISSEYAVEPAIDIQKHKKHKVHLWAEANDEIVSTDIIIEGMKEPQPYPSWTYQNDEWVAPKPKPVEKSIWSWDESKQEWISLDWQYGPGYAGTATEGQV